VVVAAVAPAQATSNQPAPLEVSRGFRECFHFMPPLSEFFFGQEKQLPDQAN
jgi:hypothetical protein